MELVKLLEQGLAWEEIPSAVSTEGTDPGKVVPLHQSSTSVLGNATMRALFGETLLEIEPRLIEYFDIFELEGWKLFYQLPSMLAKRVYNANEKSLEAYTRYFQLPIEKRPGACYHVRKIEAQDWQAGICERDIAVTAHIFFWA